MLFALPTVILPLRLFAIQSLQLVILIKRFPRYVLWAADEYTRIWETIARFPGLRQLHVWLGWELIDRKCWDDNKQLFFEPVRKLMDVVDISLTAPVCIDWIAKEQDIGRCQIYAYNDDAIFIPIASHTS